MVTIRVRLPLLTTKILQLKLVDLSRFKIHKYIESPCLSAPIPSDSVRVLQLDTGKRHGIAG
jgi:hypothetical protein